MLRAFFILCFTCLLSTPVFAQERITSFDVVIEVEQDGDIHIVETISLVKEGVQINRGIFRDLPKYHESNGEKYPYKYDIISIKRDGKKEKYKRSTRNNAIRIKVGDADVMIENGAHTYIIEYSVKNQIRYFDNYDELYWNITGSYWTFPIEQASARITLPKSGGFKQQSAYTGVLGSNAQNYSFDYADNNYNFKTTQILGRQEGLSIALGFDKGIIDPPSKADMQALWWMKNGALLLLSLSFFGIIGFYLRAWNKVGRDPVKGPIFARYEPPKNYSPAAAHRIYYKGFHGHNALIATLMGLAIKGRISLDVAKKKTVIKRISEPPVKPALSTEETALLSTIFRKRRKTVVLDKKPNTHFSRAYEKFQKKLNDKLSTDYHKYNAGYMLGGIALTIAAIILASSQIVGGVSTYFIILIGTLILTNIFFMVLLPAPTRKGQDSKSEIEGFKLYLKTAEKLQLNTAVPGSETPPAMSIKRYEAFLPYAIALNVEKPWTSHFETVMPIEAQSYNPSYAHMRSGNMDGLASLNKALVSNINSGVSNAMPQSSSSSGSGGGGFSGGGGGGGGGGGW